MYLYELNNPILISKSTKTQCNTIAQSKKGCKKLLRSANDSWKTKAVITTVIVRACLVIDRSDKYLYLFICFPSHGPESIYKLTDMCP